MSLTARILINYLFNQITSTHRHRYRFDFRFIIVHLEASDSCEAGNYERKARDSSV